MLSTHCVRGRLFSFAKRVEQALSVKNQIHRISARPVPPWGIQNALLKSDWQGYSGRMHNFGVYIFQPESCSIAGVAERLGSLFQAAFSMWPWRV